MRKLVVFLNLLLKNPQFKPTGKTFADRCGSPVLRFDASDLALSAHGSSLQPCRIAFFFAPVEIGFVGTLWL